MDQELNPRTRLEPLRLGPDQRLNMKALFEYAARVGASDLLVTAGAPPIVRVDGDLFPAVDAKLGPEHTKKLIWSLINETQQEMFERKRELDFSLAVTGEMRFRANVYYQKGAVAGAFRLIPRVIPRMEDLGVPPMVREMTLRSHGLILVTGPTGSGKTTTMASMIDLVNETRRCHIVTVEDPIEFIHTNKQGVIDQREVYADTLSFANALKYVLRQDPDVILVGELRDLETIESALRAAETGHLVFGTLHTTTAQGTVTRIVDQFPVDQQEQIRVQMSTSLIAVLCQALMPRVDVRGMVAAFEFMVITNAIANLIRENKVFRIPSAIQTGKKYGMQLLDDHLFQLYSQNKIEEQDATDRSQSPGEMQDKIKALKAGRLAAPTVVAPGAREEVTQLRK